MFKLALALTLCSEIALVCKHQCNHVIRLLEPVIPIDPSKSEANTPGKDPFSHGYAAQRRTAKLGIPHASGPRPFECEFGTIVICAFPSRVDA